MPFRPDEPVPGDAPAFAGGRYVISSRIDAGGMSAVYRVWDRKLKVARAVKVLLPEFARNQVIYQRFESEARTMARLEHPNLVRIYDVGREGDLPYLVMELVTGGSLQRWIETNGPMSPRLAIEATLQLVAGLSAVHAAGIVHRDIKPHNVLISEPGICKLTDFGIAHLDNGSNTKTGTTLGTQGYMAPEQRADAKSVDLRADLYGVGSTLWALLQGKPAHDVFVLVDRGALDTVPPYLREVLRKTVAYERGDRYPDAGTLERALRSVLTEAPPGETVSDLPLEDTTDEVPIDPGDDDIASMLQADAALARASLSPELLTGTPNPLPYYMPPVQRKRLVDPEAVSDEPPDWLTKEATPVSAGSEEVIGADVPVRSLPPASAPPSRPPSLSPAAEEPPPASDPVPAPPPPTPPLADPDPDSSGLWVYLLAPLAMLLLGALLLVLVAGGWVSRSAAGVHEAQRAAESAREQVYLVLAAEDSVVQQMKLAGIETAELEARYLAYRDAKAEPARQEAARAYLEALTAEADRSLGPDAASTAQVTAAHAVRRIRAREVAWDDAEAAWKAAGAGLGGSLAIELGLVRPPPHR